MRYLLGTALAAILLYIGVLYAKPTSISFPQATIQIVNKDTTIPLKVELALNSVQWERGLMYRKSLDNDGMLFVFPESQNITMWMKDTPLPLDMVFINEQHQVVNIARDAKPYSTNTIEAGVPSIAVLELEAGKADTLGITTNTKIMYEVRP